MKKTFDEWVERLEIAYDAISSIGYTYHKQTVPQRIYVTLDILKRIKSNIRGCRNILVELSKLNPIKDDFELKTPLSLVIRACLGDCLIGMYLESLDDNSFAEELDVINLDFVEYMGTMIPLEVELYNRLSGEKLSSLDQLDIRHEGFNRWLRSNKGELWKYEQPSAFRTNKTNNRKVGFKYISEYLKKRDSEIQAFAYMYNYYRYYSQYEHFTSIGREIYDSDFESEITRMEMSLISIIHSCYIIAKKLPNASDELLQPLVVLTHSIIPHNSNANEPL